MTLTERLASILLILSIPLTVHAEEDHARCKGYGWAIIRDNPNHLKSYQECCVREMIIDRNNHPEWVGVGDCIRHLDWEDEDGDK